MRKPTKHIHSGAALPGRDDILAFIRDHKGKVGKREIAKAFDISGQGKIALKRLLKDLQEEGVLERRGDRLRQSGVLEPVTLAEISGRDRDGELIGKPIEWDEAEAGETPRILIHLPKRAPPGLAAPGLGDRVLLRVEPLGEGSGPDYRGRILKLLPRARTEILGVFRARPEGGGRVTPIDRKASGREMLVAAGDEHGAKDDDLVSVTPGRAARAGQSLVKIREILASVKTEKAVSLIAIHAHGIPMDFSNAALAEAAAARPATPEGREDWRDLALITIDPADAKDHDDAVHAAPDPDPANPGGFIVSVAIADVAAYVRPGGALDSEALERGNSVYFPDRVTPMLPERISNDLCSLRPLEDRPAIAVRLVLGADGRKRGHSFHRVLMRSRAKLAYPQAQAAIDGAPDETTGPLLAGVLRPLWLAYACARQARQERAPLELDLPERKILLKADGTVDRVIIPPRLEAHRLIEEFMILANVAAAETLEHKRSALIYRVHGEPSGEKLRALAETLASIGVKLTAQGALRPALFNRVLARVEGTAHQDFVNEVVLRTQAQADYRAENAGHFGLNLRRYAHFTSPIRRYADLIVHRALIRAFDWGEGALTDAELPALPEIAAKISAAERRAMAAERDTVDRLIAHHLADRIGARFAGRVSGVTRAGLFVKLDETGADGFIPISTLGAEYFVYDAGRQALIGQSSGLTHRLGDRVDVRLLEAAPVAGALRFELTGGGRATAKRPGVQPRRRGETRSRGKRSSR